MTLTLWHFAAILGALLVAHFKGWLANAAASPSLLSQPGPLLGSVERAAFGKAERLALPKLLDQVPLEQLVSYLASRQCQIQAQAESAAKAQAALAAIASIHQPPSPQPSTTDVPKGQ